MNLQDPLILYEKNEPLRRFVEGCLTNSYSTINRADDIPQLMFYVFTWLIGMISVVLCSLRT